MAKKFKVDNVYASKPKKKKSFPLLPVLFFLILVGGGILISCNTGSKKETTAKENEKQNKIEDNSAVKVSTTVEEKVSSVKVNPKIHSFIDNYCIRCHGKEKQKGDRRFDQLAKEIKSEDDILAYTEILDSLNLGEMPPEKKGVKHPPVEENKFVIKWLTDSLQKIESDSIKSETVLRRLNRFEYMQTMSSLLKVNIDSFDPSDLFPKDTTYEGFDNIGNELILSDFQLKQYLAAAEKFLDKAIYFKAKPESKKMVFTGKNFSGSPKMARSGVFWVKKVEDKYIEVGHGRPTGNGVTYPDYFRRRGIPHDGYYKIRVKADAVNRLDHPYNPKDLHIDLSKKIKMALVSAHHRNGIKNDIRKRTRLKIFELEDEKPQWYETTAWMNRDSVPFVHWVNGSASTKAFINRIGYKYHKEIAGSLKAAQNNSLRGKKVSLQGKVLSDVYSGPVMRIHAWEMEGPFFKSWPPQSHQTIFGKETDPSKVDVVKTLTAFASKAFRSPQKEEDISHYIDYVKKRRELGDSHEVAIKHGLKAILTSPKFLYLGEGSGGRLNQFQLASRLSYFLWSSQPDEELIQLAAAGKLNNSTLKAQAKRMLDDPKAQAFAEHFTDSWLRLNTLGSMPPDAKKFKSYYEKRLEDAMRKETLLFFKHILHNNLSIVDMLDSDYTFINDDLADHYQIKGVQGEHFRRIDLPQNSNRGGLLGHGSILTLTSNGVETSPVIRGIWVLENILGTPPSDPPPDVEPLEPDARGSKTIKEQLKKHRDVESCAECHRKIDPIGFALENFDPVGRHRSQYPRVRGQKVRNVDASGEMPNGDSFKDEKGLKKILLERKGQFAKALSEKLMIYATGRKMTFKDHATIEAIVHNTKEKKYPLQDMVIEVILSETFKNK